MLSCVGFLFSPLFSLATFSIAKITCVCQYIAQGTNPIRGGGIYLEQEPITWGVGIYLEQEPIT